MAKPITTQDKNLHQIIVSDTILEIAREFRFNPSRFAIELSDAEKASIRVNDEVKVRVNYGTTSFRLNTATWGYCGKSGSVRRMQMMRATAEECWTVDEVASGEDFKRRSKNLAEAFISGMVDHMWNVMEDASKDGLIKFRNVGGEDAFSRAALKGIAKDITKRGRLPLLALDPSYRISIMPDNKDDFELNSTGLFKEIIPVEVPEHVAGFAAYDDGLMMANVLPPEAHMELNFDYSSRIYIEELGMEVLYAEWTDLNTRSKHASLDVYFAVGVGAPERIMLLGTDDTYKPIVDQIHGMSTSINGNTVFNGDGGTTTLTVTSKTPVAVENIDGAWLSETHTVAVDANGFYVTTFTITAAAYAARRDKERIGGITIGNGTDFRSFSFRQTPNLTPIEPIVPEESGD